MGVERREEVERNERNYVKDEQERAFQEAELADQVNNNNPFYTPPFSKLT